MDLMTLAGLDKADDFLRNFATRHGNGAVWLGATRGGDSW